MKLTSVQISNYKCIRDPCSFTISDITCLVGMNEAGKTAILEALYRLIRSSLKKVCSMWMTIIRGSMLKTTGSM